MCTHIADLDFGKIKVYVGNYDFWYQSSQLAQKWLKNKIRKRRKIKNYKISLRVSQRMLLNQNKQRGRKKQLEKIELDDIQPSSRRYPYVKFTPEREIGNDLLTVQNLSKQLMVKKY